MLVGFAVERIAGQRLDVLVERIVTAPLGSTETRCRPPPHLRERCAATEAGNAYERAKVGKDAAVAWREGVLRGEVHDGNTFYAMGGVASHAGLFSSAWDVATAALMWLRPGARLSEESVR